MKAILKLLKWLFIIIFLLLLIFYFIPGTTADLTYDYPEIPSSVQALENYVEKLETASANIKPGNEAEIVWLNDSLKMKTEYALVYLHGFSASHEEGGVVHESIAEKFGMNLYLSRLSYHGMKGKDAMGKMTAESLMASALEAVAIGKQLGKKVILMGTSTGATLGLPIMANDPSIHAGIFYSANIELFDSKSKLLTKPGGLSLAKTILDSDYYSFDPPPGAEKFWSHIYPVEATVELQTLMNTTMTTEVFTKIEQPVLFVSYFKNEEEQDDVVSVDAIRGCYERLGTSTDLKKYVELPDVAGHAMCSPFFSKNVQAPFDEAAKYLAEVLKIGYGN